MEKFKNLTSKAAVSLKQFFNATGKVLVILAAMAIGYFSNEVYRHYTKKETKVESNLSPVKTLEDILVSFSSSGEVIFIDKETGNCEIYSDSISMMIFNHQAMKMHFKAQK